MKTLYNSNSTLGVLKALKLSVQTLSLLGVLFFANHSHAQNRNQIDNSLFFTPFWSFSLSISNNQFNSESASRELVKDRALGLNASAHYWWQYVFMSVGVDYINYSDRAGFSQTTTDIYGDIDRSSSDADAVNMLLAVGPYWEFGADRHSIVAAQLGYSFSLNSERSIAYCDDCYSEDIELDPGFALKFSLLHPIGHHHFGIEYSAYPASDDYKSSFGLVWHLGL